MKLFLIVVFVAVFFEAFHLETQQEGKHTYTKIERIK
jgi:hypothetical protein